MLSYVVPCPYLFENFFDSEGKLHLAFPAVLREKLLSRLSDLPFGSDTPFNKRFFLFDNFINDKGIRLRASGWVSGQEIPAKVFSLPRPIAIDIVRELFDGYPVFTESFQTYRYIDEGRVAGVFSVPS